jgi:hypothetical protein
MLRSMRSMSSGFIFRSRGPSLKAHHCYNLIKSASQSRSRSRSRGVHFSNASWRCDRCRHSSWVLGQIRVLCSIGFYYDVYLLCTVACFSLCLFFFWLVQKRISPFFASLRRAADHFFWSFSCMFRARNMAFWSFPPSLIRLSEFECAPSFC